MKEEKEAQKEGEVLKLGPNLACVKGDHEFKYVTALEVECMKCPIGYPLGPGSELKNGHIYRHGEKII